LVAQLVVPTRLRKLVGRLFLIMVDDGTLRWLLASEPHKVLTHSKIPVLVYH
jgi:hypothetical protein